MIALVLAGTAAWAKTDVSIHDDLTLGPHRYSANNLDLGVAPDPAFSADLSYGTNRSTTPVADSTHQLGVGLWAAFSPVVTVSANYLGYTGDKAPIVNLLGDVVGEANDRIRTGTLGAKVGFKLIRPDEDGDLPVSFRLDLGAGGGTESMPLFVQFPPIRAGAPPPAPRKLAQSYDIRDREFTAGMTGRIGGTSITATYARHHYTDNLADIEAGFLAQARTHPRLGPLILNTLSGIRYNATSSAQGQPKYDSYVGVTRALDRDWSVTASYDYQDMMQAGQIARQPTLDVAWEAAKWCEVRLGSYWVNQFRRNSRYTTSGVSFFF
jgi:hypothetical protein